MCRIRFSGFVFAALPCPNVFRSFCGLATCFLVSSFPLGFPLAPPSLDCRKVVYGILQGRCVRVRVRVRLSLCVCVCVCVSVRVSVSEPVPKRQISSTLGRYLQYSAMVSWKSEAPSFCEGCAFVSCRFVSTKSFTTTSTGIRVVPKKSDCYHHACMCLCLQPCSQKAAHPQLHVHYLFNGVGHSLTIPRP